MLDAETQPSDVSSGDRTRVGCVEADLGAWEQCTTAWGAEHHSWGSVGGGLGLQKKEVITAGKGEKRRGRTTIGISFSVHGHVGSRVVECLLHRLGSRSKPPLSAQTLGVGTARHYQGSMNSHHLKSQSPQGLLLRRALQPNTTHCPHSPGNIHTLLLPLLKALGTAYTSLRVTATSQGPATRSSLCHSLRSSSATRHWLKDLLIASISLEASAGCTLAYILPRG